MPSLLGFDADDARVICPNGRSDGDGNISRDPAHHSRPFLCPLQASPPFATRPRHASATCPRAPVSGGSHLWTAAGGAADARRHAPAPSRALGRGGRATMSPWSARRPGLLRSSQAASGPAPRGPGGRTTRAHGACPGSALTIRRLRPGGPASPAGERGPLAPGGSAVPHATREPAPVETAGTGRVLRASPQRRRGSPLGERRQAMTCARVITRNSSGRSIPTKAVKSVMSSRYASRVLALGMLANHSSSGGTSERPWNSRAVNARDPE